MIDSLTWYTVLASWQANFEVTGLITVTEHSVSGIAKRSG